MDLQITPARRITQPVTDLQPGALSWAPVHKEISATAANVKDAVFSGPLREPCIFAAGRLGVRRWLGTGRSEVFLPNEAVPAGIHTIAVVSAAKALFCCSSEGNVACFDLSTGAKQKVFSAHIGEITCTLTWADPRTGTSFLATGGVDFQVKTWTPSGQLLAGSGHHHGQINCLHAMLPATPSHAPAAGPVSAHVPASRTSRPAAPRSNQATPRPRPSNGSRAGASRRASFLADSSQQLLPEGPGPLLLSGCSDGSIFVWEDKLGTGLLCEAEGQYLRHPLQKGVASLQGVMGSIWAGYSDGRLIIWRPDPGGGGFSFGAEFKHHTDQVSCMCLLGRQVWLGSADRTISACDAVTGQLLFRIPDQGGYIKALVPFGWAIWAFTSKGISVLSSEAAWLAALEAGGGVLIEAKAAEVRRLEDAAEGYQAEIAQLQGELHNLAAAAEREAAEASALRALLEAQLEAQRAQHEAEIEALRAQHAQRASDVEAEAQAAAAAAKDLALEEAQARHAVELEAQRAQHEAALVAQRAQQAAESEARHVKQLAGLEAQHAQQMAELQSRLQATAAEGTAALGAAQARHAAELATVKAQHQADTAQLELARAQHAAELEALKAAHALESQGQREQHSQAVEAVRRELASQVRDMEARYHAQLEAQKAGLAAQRAEHARLLADAGNEAQAELQQLKEALEASQRAAAQQAQQHGAKVQELQAALAAAQQQLREQEQQQQERWGQQDVEADARLSRLQAEVAAQQAQHEALQRQLEQQRVEWEQRLADQQAQHEGQVARVKAESEEARNRQLADASVQAGSMQAGEVEELREKLHLVEAELAAAYQAAQQYQHTSYEQQEQHAAAVQQAQQPSGAAQEEAAAAAVQKRLAAAGQEHASALEAAKRKYAEQLAAHERRYREQIEAVQALEGAAKEQQQRHEQQLEALRRQCASEVAAQRAEQEKAVQGLQRELGLIKQECAQLQARGLQLQQATAGTEGIAVQAGAAGSRGARVTVGEAGKVVAVERQPAKWESGLRQDARQGRGALGRQDARAGALVRSCSDEGGSAAAGASVRVLSEAEARQMHAMVKALKKKLARETTKCAATQARITELEASLLEATHAYQNLASQLKSLQRQQFEGQLGQQQQQKEQQQEGGSGQRGREEGQPPDGQPPQQEQLLARLERAEVAAAQRDAAIAILKEANALLFQHAQGMGADLQGYALGASERAGLALEGLQTMGASAQGFPTHVPPAQQQPCQPCPVLGSPILALPVMAAAQPAVAVALQQVQSLPVTPVTVAVGPAASPLLTAAPAAVPPSPPVRPGERGEGGGGGGSETWSSSVGVGSPAEHQRTRRGRVRFLPPNGSLW